MKTFEEFRQREAEFRKATHDWIVAQDQHYREVEQNAIARNPPIRHPNGHIGEKHDREWLWLDGLWCGDIGSDPLEEFFELEGDEWDAMLDSQGDEESEYGLVWAWSQRIFDEEFRAVCPDIAHVLEG